MTADELFKAGQLQEAITQQFTEVKSAPKDQQKRLFLFELLVFSGELERAKKQLDLLKFDELELETAAYKYRKLLESEECRRQVFAGKAEPSFLAPPPEHVLLRVKALQAITAGDNAEASSLLAQAQEAEPPLAGVLNETPIEAFRDCDDLLGPTLEVMAEGHYYWLSLSQVELLALNAPRFPRDIIWMPGRLEVAGGPNGEAFLPSLYPSTHLSDDIELKLGRVTDWKELENGPVLGLGVHQFLINEDAISILELRQLEVEQPDIPADASSAESSEDSSNPDDSSSDAK